MGRVLDVFHCNIKRYESKGVGTIPKEQIKVRVKRNDTVKVDVLRFNPIIVTSTTKIYQVWGQNVGRFY